MNNRVYINEDDKNYKNQLKSSIKVSNFIAHYQDSKIEILLNLFHKNNNIINVNMLHCIQPYN